jgi:hypothetical protein
VTPPDQPFSSRFSARPKPPQTKPDEMPELIRVKLVPLIDEFRGGRGLPGAYTVGPALYEAIGKIPPQPVGDMHMIRHVFREAEWWQVYDLAEALVKMCGRRDEMAARIEGIFAEANVPYAMTPGGIVWRFSEPAVEAINETARLLVEEPTLIGPAQQWEKALGHLSARPPDSENCIKDAIGAVEGTGRILSGREKENLSKLIFPFAKEVAIHPTLAVMVDKLYAYRGDEQAVAHGATRELKATPADAELVLHVSAAVIVYFSKKYNATP